MSKQNIDTKDFNAITSFNGKQYFSINDEETFDKSFTNLYNLPKPKISRTPIMFNMPVNYLKFERKAMVLKNEVSPSFPDICKLDINLRKSFSTKSESNTYLPGYLIYLVKKSLRKQSFLSRKNQIQKKIGMN